MLATAFAQQSTKINLTIFADLNNNANERRKIIEFHRRYC